MGSKITAPIERRWELGEIAARPDQVDGAPAFAYGQAASRGHLPCSVPLYGPTARGGSSTPSPAAFPTSTPDCTGSAPPHLSDYPAAPIATSSTETSTD